MDNINVPSVSIISSKRPASASPVGDHDPKRLRLVTDLWSEDEHLQQDEIVKQLLRGTDDEPKTHDIGDRFHILHILETVAHVACEGRHSRSLRYREGRDALKKDPALMKLIGDCYTNGSYKNVRCLGASILAPVAINFSNISAFPEFLRENPVSDSAITPRCKSFHRISPAFN